MPAVRVSAIRWRLAVLALACTGLGCLVPYRPPTYEQPHAVLKYRRAYLMQAGASLSEVLSVDGYAALNLTVPSQTAATARTDAVMVHPQPATLRVDSTFFHNQTRSVEERYTEQVPYTASESDSCGSGYGTSYSCRTCTRTVTHYRSETRYRTVMRTERVVDAACHNELALTPARDGVYLLELDFQGHRACRLSCYQQIHAADGSFRNSRCPLTLPKE
jgi:hypothetical protein